MFFSYLFKYSTTTKRNKTNIINHFIKTSFFCHLMFGIIIWWCWLGPNGPGLILIHPNFSIFKCLFSKTWYLLNTTGRFNIISISISISIALSLMACLIIKHRQNGGSFFVCKSLNRICCSKRESSSVFH